MDHVYYIQGHNVPLPSPPPVRLVRRHRFVAVAQTVSDSVERGGTRTCTPVYVVGKRVESLYKTEVGRISPRTTPSFDTIRTSAPGFVPSVDVGEREYASLVGGGEFADVK